MLSVAVRVGAGGVRVDVWVVVAWNGGGLEARFLST
jgi:hypothetical protein